MDLADDKWASLLPDLLLDIFRRLETTAVIRCATSCKPWRRTILSNASSFHHARLDSFVPSLLLGFFLGYDIGCSCPMLYHMPAPWQPVLPEPDVYGGCTFVPPPTMRGGNLLSSRDGFLLVKRRSEFNPICLWNPVAGTCTFHPLPSLTPKTYGLLSDYDDLPGSCSSNKPEVRIFALAVQKTKQLLRSDGGGGYCCWSFRYQLFSAGAWGPVKRSEEVAPEMYSLQMRPGTEVVCRRGTVHWLAWSFFDTYDCVVALDLGTGRTWMTALPIRWRLETRSYSLDLATSRDGRLSVIRIVDQQQIQVWVLTGGREWFLQRVVFVHVLMPDVQDIQDSFVRAFSALGAAACLSRWIGSCTSSTWIRARPVGFRAPSLTCTGGQHPYPYEMDWSDYWRICLSKMKHF